MVMNCVNLRSMKPAKWLSSPRWMGHRSSKVRTQHCRTERDREKREGEREGGRKRDAGCAVLTCTFYHSFSPSVSGRQISFLFWGTVTVPFNLSFHRVQIWPPFYTIKGGLNFWTALLQVSCRVK